MGDSGFHFLAPSPEIKKGEVLGYAAHKRNQQFSMYSAEKCKMTMGILEDMLKNEDIYLVHHDEEFNGNSTLYETNKQCEPIIHTYRFLNVQRKMLNIAATYAMHILFMKRVPKVEFTLKDWNSLEFEKYRWRCNWWAREFVYPLRRVEMEVAKGTPLHAIAEKFNYNIKSGYNVFWEPVKENLDEPRIWDANPDSEASIAIKKAYGVKLNFWETLIYYFSKSCKKYRKRPDGSEYMELYW